MLIFLIVALIAIDIGIRIMIISLDVAYFISSRMESMVSGVGDVKYYATKPENRGSKSKRILSKTTRKTIKAGVHAIKTTARTGLRLALSVVHLVLSILIKLLMVLEVVVIFLDFFIFVLLASSCWFWLSKYGIGGVK